jgi:NAD(P)-dependent dehydrogenase (short-subunit alcohol dehydrogenase family)
MLAAEGKRVMAVGRDEERLASLTRQQPMETLAVDLASAGGCAHVVAETRRRLGPITILINNAGRGGVHDRAIWEQDPNEWELTLAVNLTAPFELTRLAVADMRDAEWGRIVMVSSTAGVVGAPALGAYSASKHGLIGLARSVAQDVASYGVTCNAVLPGWVRSQQADADAEREAQLRGITTEQVWRERAASYPAGRIVEAEEVASVITFLVSEQASGVNGETITVALGSSW